NIEARERLLRMAIVAVEHVLAGISGSEIARIVDGFGPCVSSQQIQSGMESALEPHLQAVIGGGGLIGEERDRVESGVRADRVDNTAGGRGVAYGSGNLCTLRGRHRGEGYLVDVVIERQMDAPRGAVSELDQPALAQGMLHVQTVLQAVWIAQAARNRRQRPRWLRAAAKVEQRSRSRIGIAGERRGAVCNGARRVRRIVLDLLHSA